MLVNRAIFACLGLVVAATFTTMDSRSAAAPRPQQDTHSRPDSELVRRTALLEVKMKIIAKRVDEITERLNRVAVVVASQSDDNGIEGRLHDAVNRVDDVENRLGDVEAKLQGFVPSRRLELDCRNAEMNLNGPDPTPLAHSFLSACIADIRQALRSFE